MTTFILIHGSWHTGESWHKVQQILEENGAQVYAPTLTGMESRKNPGGSDVGVSTHIQDIVGLIEEKNLRDVVLVGHSYSGFVIGGVADRMPERVKQLIYLDAFNPEDGESLFDILGAESEAGMRAGLVDAQGRTLAEGAEEVWLLPPGSARGYLGEDADEETVSWLEERLVYKPVLTFAEKLHFQDQAAVRAIPSAHIECAKFPFLAWLGEKARGLGWDTYQIDTGHDAMLTKPEELAKLFLAIVQ